MPENTSPHSNASSPSGQPADPWAEATDPVEPGAAGSEGDTADTDQARAARDRARAEARAERDEARAARDEARAERDRARAEERERPERERFAQESARADTAGASAQGDDDRIRKILADVAAGKIAPNDAAGLIEKARGSGPGATSSPAGSAGAATTTATSAEEPVEGSIPATATTTRLRVRAVGRRVRIIGEPFVSTVAVDGPHVVRQEGDTLVVTSEGEFGASIDGFTLMRTRSLRDVQERVFDIGRELSVRVNPNLAVEVEVTAGSVNAERLPRLEQVRVTAGSARVRDADGPIDLLVQAGSAQVEGAFTKGHSRLRAESGSLQLRLLPGSSVRIRPDVQLGRVQWEPPGKDREEHVVGSGDGVLDLEVVMGTATVKEAQ